MPDPKCEPRSACEVALIEGAKRRQVGRCSRPPVGEYLAMPRYRRCWHGPSRKRCRVTAPARRQPHRLEHRGRAPRSSPTSATADRPCEERRQSWRAGTHAATTPHRLQCRVRAHVRSCSGERQRGRVRRRQCPRRAGGRAMGPSRWSIACAAAAVKARSREAPCPIVPCPSSGSGTWMRGRAHLRSFRAAAGNLRAPPRVTRPANRSRERSERLA